MENQTSPSISVALCLDGEVLNRFSGVLRNLLIGLVDQAVGLRLVSPDPRVEALTLGPIQTVVHERVVWPFSTRRLDALLDALSPQPPTVVHAMSGASYRVAVAIAETFEADLVVQVTSLADCDAIANLPADRIGRFLALSQPLLSVLADQLKIPAEALGLIRPGVLASSEVACFTDPKRIPSILCLSALERHSGVDQLIEAARILRQREHSFMLFLLGRGPQESALRQAIHNNKLSSHVTVAQPSGDTVRALLGADVFVRPSADTAFHGHGLLAMGLGLAVVTQPGAVYDCFRHGETAVVCDKPTAVSLADAIEQTLINRDFARGIATKGLEYVRTHHAVSRMAEQTVDTYRKLAFRRATFPIKEKRA